MLKKFLTVIFLIFFTILESQAFEDCIVFTKGKMTDIRVEDNTMLDVYPLVTIYNEKNTLVVHPLKEGNTRFCILKNNKDIVMFNVNITEFETVIDSKDGFEIYTLDKPFDEFEFTLDNPPLTITGNEKTE